MSTDPRIDAYIEAAAPFAQPILTHLRALVHRVLPDAVETIKWGMPHFTVGGKNLCGLAAFKAHCAFVIHGEGRQGGVAAGADGDGMGYLGKITALGDLPSDAELEATLIAVRERIAAKGSATARREPRQPRAEVPTPEELARALAANPAAQATYAAFAPSHQRDYNEWIAEAKTDATRAKRIAQAVEWLAEGKRRNWKYEKC